MRTISRRSGRVDIFCCCCLMPGDGNWPCMEGSTANQGESNVEMKKKHTIMSVIPPDRQPAVTYLASNNASVCIPYRVDVYVYLYIFFIIASRWAKYKPDRNDNVEFFVLFFLKRYGKGKNEFSRKEFGIQFVDERE